MSKTTLANSLETLVSGLCTIIAVTAYRILFTYFNNVAECSILEVLPLLIKTILVCICAHLIICYVIKNIDMATICCCVLILICMDFASVEKGIHLLSPIFRYWHIVFLLFALFAITVYLCKDIVLPKPMVPIVFFVFLGLIFLNGILAAPTISAKMKNERILSNEIQVGESEKEEKIMPNIYYLIFDEYAGFKAIRNVFDYDNDTFAKYLEEKGFSVSYDSFNHTALTINEIPNYINLDYISYGLDIVEISKYISSDSALFHLMKKKGYTIEGAGESSRWGIESLQQTESVQQTDKDGNNFQGMMLQNTILYPFIKRDVYAQAKMINVTFDFLARLELKDGDRKMIFSYLCFPHLPFLFDKDGKNIDYGLSNNPESYLGQYIYATDQIRNLISEITKQDPHCVIILQSDHGYRGIFKEEADMRNIINAVYYQGQKKLPIQGLTGVDTLRVVMNELFDTDFERLGPYEE